MAEAPVLLQLADRITTATFSRPKRLNVLDGGMVEAPWQAMAHGRGGSGRARHHPYRAGRTFCAVGGIGGSAAWVQPSWSQQRMFLVTGMLVIGMLHGAVDGLRLLYALFCDLHFMQDDTVATTAFADPA